MDTRVSTGAPMEARRRRRRCNNKKSVSAAAVSVHDVPDDLLRQILLRLDSPLWLIRAASACKRWRIVIAGADGGGAFLRLARLLHPPAIVGHYHDRCGPVAFVPSSPPAPIDGSRFSLDFLPFAAGKSSEWKVRDCHGGLVLLEDGHCPPDLIVCDPLTRRYQGIHHPTEHWEETGFFFADAFLLAGEDGDLSISNFRVLFRFYEGPRRACVFSTANGGGWRFLPPPPSEDDDLDRDCMGLAAGRVDGSLYIGLVTGSLIVLDNATLEFAEVDLASKANMSDDIGWYSRYRVVHGAAAVAGDPASPATARVVHVYLEEVEVFRRVIHGGVEWVLEHSIRRLSEATRGLPGFSEKTMEWEVFVVAGGTGFVVLSVWSSDDRTRWLFSVDVETMKLEVVPESSYRGTRAASAYTLPWPTFMRECPRVKLT